MKHIKHRTCIFTYNTYKRLQTSRGNKGIYTYIIRVKRIIGHNIKTRSLDNYDWSCFHRFENDVYIYFPKAIWTAYSSHFRIWTNMFSFHSLKLGKFVLTTLSRANRSEWWKGHSVKKWYSLSIHCESQCLHMRSDSGIFGFECRPFSICRSWELTLHLVKYLRIR